MEMVGMLSYVLNVVVGRTLSLVSRVGIIEQVN